MNWYAVWSATISVIVGILVLVVADPSGGLWRDVRAERDLYKWRMKYYQAIAIERTNVLVACAEGKALSFPGLLVFCDPQQAPIMTMSVELEDK